MERRRSYNPHGQRLDRETLEKISQLYCHIFDMTNYVYFYDGKAYLGTKNEPMNNGASQKNLDENEMMEHLITDWSAEDMYILTNIDFPITLSIGTFVRQLTNGDDLDIMITEIKRCLNNAN